MFSQPLLTMPPGPYRGEVLRRRRLGPAMLSRCTYSDVRDQAWHVHAAPTLYIVLSGAVEERFEDAAAMREPGAAVFIPEGVAHRTVRTTADTQVLDLQFASTWFGSLRDRLPLRWLTWRTVGEVASELEETAWSGAGEARATALVLRLLADLGRGPAGDGAAAVEPAWLARAESLIRTRLPETAPLDEIAGACGVDRSTLTRGFREHRALSVGQFVRLERVVLARRLLEETDLPLAEVAARAGFADQPHLTRVFRAVVGMTPGRCRRRER